jgi:hypothetical protein
VIETFVIPLFVSTILSAFTLHRETHGNFCSDRGDLLGAVRSGNGKDRSGYRDSRVTREEVFMGYDWPEEL